MRRPDPDAHLMADAVLWAQEQTGHRFLVLAKDEQEHGAFWVRYYPAPFLIKPVTGRIIMGSCLLLRPGSQRSRLVRVPA